MTPAQWIPIIAAEFATVDLSGAISAAELRIRDGLGGDKRPLLVAYLAAHIYTVAIRSSGGTGAISKVSEGGVSIEYDNGTNSKIIQRHSSTTYGKEYDSMSDDLVIGAMVV